MDLIKDLRSVDTHIRGIILSSSESEVQEFVLGLLTTANEEPGRAAKFQVVYLLERMAEIIQDLKETVEAVQDKEEGMMRWVDRGLSYASYLVEPGSQGKWLPMFDQTLTVAHVPNPKDPAAVSRRASEAAKLSTNWNRTLVGLRQEHQVKEPSRPAQNLIVMP